MVGTKSGSKNPGSFSQTPAPFNPSFSPDQRQFYNSRAAEYGNTINLSDAQNRANQTISAISRVQVDYTPFMFTGVGVDSGAILIPRNANRLAWYIINCGDVPIIWSFNQISDNGAAPHWGFSLPDATTNPNQNWFSEINDAVGINDIYVYPKTHGDVLNILAYEGVASLSTGS